jgi:hypothetical protein
MKNNNQINDKSKIDFAINDYKLPNQCSSNKFITNLWLSTSEKDWDAVLDKYWTYIRNDNINLEIKMESLDANSIISMNTEDFYKFLYDEYFVWKYTAKNRLATTRKYLQKYYDENKMHELKKIKSDLFSFDTNDIKRGLEIVSSIYGLGIAGASGLLALLFPDHFATVDQFVVKALVRVENLLGIDVILQMNPVGLKIDDGVFLISVMQEQANKLNRENQTSYWTPRKVDKALWTIGR